MTYTETARIDSEILETTYIMGRTETGYIYIWTDQPDDIDLEALLSDPLAERGANAGTADEMRDDFENCVGSFRDYGSPDQAEAAQEVVDTLEAGLR